MSSPTILSCSECNKIYKSRGALLKHQTKCNAIEHITTDITENIRCDNISSENITTDIAETVDIIPPEIQREFKEQIQALMNSKEPPPYIEPIKGENILVNTAVIDSLMKSVITELFDHQHKQMQTILEQNKKLAEENKMLIKVLRSIVLARHQDGTNQTVNDDSDDSS
jgi:hypothetical protein